MGKGGGVNSAFIIDFMIYEFGMNTIHLEKILG